jgi:CheY-like chemotaxis protein
MSLSGLKILLAEDNPTNQMVAMQMLESLNAQVTLAVDGAEALDILENHSFDLALIDIEMPRLSGIDLIRRLRASDDRLARMPLVALTAYVMREHRAAIDGAGADGIIAKPILSIDEFGDEILGFMKLRARRNGTQDAVSEQSGQDDGASIDMMVYQRLFSSFDEDGTKELKSRVCADIEAAGARVAKSIETNDLTELRAATHILISVAGAIGANKLQSLSQCLNSAGHDADSAVIGRDGPEIAREIERVLRFVRGAAEE